MPIAWSFANEAIDLKGLGKAQINTTDSQRQAETAKTILERLQSQPGVLLADEVGMGKTYVAMAVMASVVLSTRPSNGPIVVMVPSGLLNKWQRDWAQFKTHNILNGALSKVRDAYARNPTEFFKLLDDKPKDRARIIFITIGCFSRGLNDPWVKLAMIRIARGKTKLDSKQNLMLCRWAADLIRQSSNKRLTEAVVETLLKSKISDWKSILVNRGILQKDADDPVPAQLMEGSLSLNWKELCDILRKIPKFRPASSSQREDKRKKFSGACHQLYKEWLKCVHWRAPLLVLDEAHHAKNDDTRLAQLFRQDRNDSTRSAQLFRKESSDDVALLEDKFDRMLFLTATPFQLGHRELIRVLKSFKAVRWSSKEAPDGSREAFEKKIGELEEALDVNRLAGKRFDKQWGKLRSNTFDGANQDEDGEHRVLSWWERAEKIPADAREQELVRAYRDCVESKERAESVLKPWLIRHNRLRLLPDTDNTPRRSIRLGNAICTEMDGISDSAIEGLSIHEHALMPFLITARAQGQLAQSANTRAYFAEGLASSYEAFHHTREDRIRAKESDDGYAADDEGAASKLPLRWYEEQVAQLVPSRKAAREVRMKHPKIKATVERVVRLWQAGEKVLVFCHYIQTGKALEEHIREEINQKILDIAGKKLGLDAQRKASEIENWLDRIVRRLSDDKSPFHKVIVSLLDEAMDKPEYEPLRQHREIIRGVLLAYLRTHAFVARYLPLDKPRVRLAFGKRETRRDVIAEGMTAMRHVILEKEDASGQTFMARVKQFLDFANELAERAERQSASEEDASDEATNPLQEYLKAISKYSKGAKDGRPDSADAVGMADDGDDGSYRAKEIVRRVYGKTKATIRDGLMLAFNSPLFPEILVSSSVMGEGVDLHRFCRHIIHHDLCWNPSTIEQRTGRLDRVRCKAEVCKEPIEVYEPFLAGSADEKMFRVLRDRERWFQIVMGQKFEFDEATAETFASRILLPEELAKTITFKLSCWEEPLPANPPAVVCDEFDANSSVHEPEG